MNLTGCRSLLNRSVDPLVALGLLALGVYEIWVETGQVAGSRAGNTVLLAGLCAATSVRRRRPLATVAVVTVCSIVWSYAWYLERQLPFVVFVALLLSTYTSAARLGGRRAVLAAGFIAAYVAADSLAAVIGSRAVGDTGAVWIFLPLTWALGRVVQRQRMLAGALAERASDLERERDEKARLAVALERARIARELHDVVTHNVSVMVVQAGVERRSIGDAHEPTREVLASIEQTGRATLVELRRLLGVVRKGDDTLPLAPQPTLDQLHALLAQATEAGLPVELRIEGEPAQLAAGVELSAYRIVQEALTNVLKHAGPARATVLIGYGAGTLTVEVADDGRGPGTGTDRGQGLAGMRERVALHGGTLVAGRQDGRGFVVHASLPVAGP